MEEGWGSACRSKAKASPRVAWFCDSSQAESASGGAEAQGGNLVFGGRGSH